MDKNGDTWSQLDAIKTAVESIDGDMQDAKGQQGWHSHLKVLEHLGHEHQKALMVLGSQLILIKWAAYALVIVTIAGIWHRW